MTIIDHTGEQILEVGDKFVQITRTEKKIAHKITEITTATVEAEGAIVITETENAGEQRFNKKRLQKLINRSKDYTTAEGFKYRLTQ
jgi:hypothetical protein